MKCVFVFIILLLGTDQQDWIIFLTVILNCSIFTMNWDLIPGFGWVHFGVVYISAFVYRLVSDDMCSNAIYAKWSTPPWMRLLSLKYPILMFSFHGFCPIWCKNSQLQEEIFVSWDLSVLVYRVSCLDTISSLMQIWGNSIWKPSLGFLRPYRFWVQRFSCLDTNFRDGLGMWRKLVWKPFSGCLKFDCFRVVKFSPLCTQIFMGDFEEMRKFRLKTLSWVFQSREEFSHSWDASELVLLEIISAEFLSPICFTLKRQHCHFVTQSGIKHPLCNILYKHGLLSHMWHSWVELNGDCFCRIYIWRMHLCSYIHSRYISPFSTF